VFVDETTPVRLAVMDRSGGVIASKDLPSVMLECISADGRFVIVRELDRVTGDWTVVGRDRSLAPIWRIGGANQLAIHQASGLLLSSSGNRLSAFLVPR